MLTIRDEQMRTLAEAQLETSKRRLAALVAQRWPEAAALWGEAGTRRRVDFAVAQTGRRGIDDLASVATYLDVMAVLGPGFEADARFPWAAPILDNPALRPATRLRQLHAEVGAWLAARAGEAE
ncbi:hypothetical protein [Duganella violaceipulchra]|uniref:Uncharacterized protein n=1 Tax=Duganella violaceipulchra TaxID=2849652 RepID=A0AA41HIR2_9BURK|nr:hypothetical protein [Duganella violaceicalia]MBV6324578.1 hypothetical protein [Duganella violaceicalia]MCP2009285.1 hypothetical protein [Duganella violaceicalia]